MLPKPIKPIPTPLFVVCDICRIRLPTTRIAQNKVTQFIRDHHVCDPEVGVRIVDLTVSNKAARYTNVRGVSE